MFASYRPSNSGSLNPFPLTNLRSKVELMYLVRMRRHRGHKSRLKWCRAQETTASLYENGCAEFKYDVIIQTGSSNMVEAVHAQ